ncbi:hypothetical protein [Bowmanella denitrificans]|uniref:hypothetical protein n=1 Tax=Bowmanella denitrificans TaxID=366582 RepID=UPI000C9997EA|nr:hypothetical protein [Bowmanella denitrificans]
MQWNDFYSLLGEIDFWQTVSVIVLWAVVAVVRLQDESYFLTARIVLISEIAMMGIEMLYEGKWLEIPNNIMIFVWYWTWISIYLVSLTVLISQHKKFYLHVGRVAICVGLAYSAAVLVQLSRYLDRTVWDRNLLVDFYPYAVQTLNFSIVLVLGLPLALWVFRWLSRCIGRQIKS